MLTRHVERQTPVAPDGAALGLVVANADQPIAERDERLVGVLARVDEALQALVLLDHGAGPAAEPAVFRSATRRLVLAQDDRALTALGVTVELEQLLVRAAPGRVE